MSIKGFEVGGVQAKYDYESLDNIPANLVQDANYVHTDNNYTNADKTKLSGIEAQANKTTIDATLTHSGQAADAKATGDEIGDLKSAFDDAIEIVIVGASANLYNPATTTDGKRISSSGELVDNSAFRVSEYIHVAPGDVLYTNAYTTELSVTNAYPDFCTYTADKIFVQRYVEVDTRANGFVVPENIHYIRVSENYYHNYNRTLMVSIGERLTTATPYDSGIKKNELKNPVTFYEEFRVVAFGDSMVELGDWETYLSSIIGCPVANMGIGGTKLANRNKQYWIDDNGKYKGEATDPQPAGTTLRWDAISGYPVGASDTNDRIDCIPTDTDICLVEFGTNDLHQDTPLGAWTDTDNNSFRGAMKLCASRIRTRANHCKVIFVTPTAERTDFVNSLNLTKKDYISAMLEAELEINVPVINLFALTSWSAENYANYSTDNLHWNIEGQKIVARIIGGYLLAQKPFPFE